MPEEDVFYCSARDIDAEKQQALELAGVASERERLWQSSRDILLAIDVDGTVVSTNPAASAILGWSREQLLGSKVFDWVLADACRSRTRRCPTPARRRWESSRTAIGTGMAAFAGSRGWRRPKAT